MVSSVVGSTRQTAGGVSFRTHSASYAKTRSAGPDARKDVTRPVAASTRKTVPLPVVRDPNGSAAEGELGGDEPGADRPLCLAASQCQPDDAPQLRNVRGALHHPERAGSGDEPTRAVPFEADAVEQLERLRVEAGDVVAVEAANPDEAPVLRGEADRLVEPANRPRPVRSRVDARDRPVRAVGDVDDVADGEDLVRNRPTSITSSTAFVRGSMRAIELGMTVGAALPSRVRNTPATTPPIASAITTAAASRLRERAIRRTPRRHREHRVLAEDRLLEHAQLLARLDPQLVDERGARGTVRLQRIRLAAGAVKGEHLLRPEVLAKRMVVCQAVELRDQLAVLPRFEVAVDPRLETGEAQLLEPLDLRSGEVGIGELGECRSPPEPNAAAGLSGARRSNRAASSSSASTRST